MERIGLIGLGNVGGGFARTLREAGCPLTVLDKDPDKLKPALALGADAAATPGEVADKTQIIILSLPGSPPVEAVMEGPDGILTHLRKDQLVIDTGTTRPQTDIHYETLCRASGAGLIDAPITGRSKGWIMMVGGSESDFNKARALLSSLTYKLQHARRPRRSRAGPQARQPASPRRPMGRLVRGRHLRTAGRARPSPAQRLP